MNNTLKIIDFGTSTEFSRGTPLKDTVGTSYYIAPEVLNKCYDERCDVWSIGCILYILLSGKPPFDGAEDGDITAKVKTGKYKMTGESWATISDDAKGLIKQMLTYDYKERVTAREALQDPWFKNAPSQKLAAKVMRDSLENLRTFNASQKLQQATLSMMVQNMISKEETARLQAVFKELDENGDGKLQYDEVLKGYTAYFGEDVAQLEVKRLFELADIDHSGEIDFSEFILATVNRNSLMQEEKLRQAFRFYDKDDSGSISTDEIKSVLGVGKKISEEVWAEVVREVDANGDGEVDFSEFKTMMEKLLTSDK